MASWSGTSRSNYFRVVDRAAFNAAIAASGAEVEILEDGDKVGLLASTEYGNWPNYDSENDKDFDLESIVAEHLADDEVAVFQSVGAEKARYLSGCAVAINNKGGREVIDIDDIYERAKNLGSNCTLATY